MKTNLVIFACFTALTGCGAASQSIDNSDDPELLGAVTDGKADSLSSTSTYYTMRPDLRKCMYPLCGGSFIQRVNRVTTRCVDGQLHDQCRVLDVDYSALGFTADELASFAQSAVIVRGTIAPTQVNGSTYGILKVSEVWQPATETAPDGTIYRLTDSGIRCITTPCPAVHEAKLNATSSANLGGFDLSESDATDAQINDAYDAVFGGQAILVAGHHSTVYGPGGKSRELDGNQLYFRVIHVAAPTCAAGQYYDVTGACGAANLPGTCTTVPQFCYHIYKPVCGCDGKTYSNQCVRLAAKVQLDHDGACAGSTP